MQNHENYCGELGPIHRNVLNQTVYLLECYWENKNVYGSLPVHKFHMPGAQYNHAVKEKVILDNLEMGDLNDDAKSTIGEQEIREQALHYYFESPHQHSIVHLVQYHAQWSSVSKHPAQYNFQRLGAQYNSIPWLTD